LVDCDWFVSILAWDDLDWMITIVVSDYKDNKRYGIPLRKVIARTRETTKIELYKLYKALAALKSHKDWKRRVAQ